ncbi:MAG: TatD family hydrolase [Candidatus Helarchaeota archaeon]
MYFDSHCHLSLFSEIPAVIQKARESGVKYILAVSMYYKDNWDVLELAAQHKEVIPALGIHPIEATALHEIEGKIETICRLITEHKVKCIGEIGLDRYFVKNKEGWEQQEIVFRHFLKYAEERQLTVNLHGKSAEKELIELLADYEINKVVIHWFAGGGELIEAGVKRGYHFSVTPEVCYGSRTQQLVEKVPIELLLSESDGPVKYKKPQQFVGEPAMMKAIIQKIAKIKQQDSKEIERIIYQNALQLFLED